MNRSQEIIQIFEPILTRDLIISILQIERNQNYRESMDYWIDTIPIYQLPISNYNRRDRYRLEHIKRIKGSVEDINRENRDIKYLRLCNHKWLIAWSKIRLKNINIL